MRDEMITETLAKLGVLHIPGVVEYTMRLAREAEARGAQKVAKTGCCGKDRVCCYDCWQLQTRLAGEVGKDG